MRSVWAGSAVERVEHRSNFTKTADVQLGLRQVFPLCICSKPCKAPCVGLSAHQVSRHRHVWCSNDCTRMLPAPAKTYTSDWSAASRHEAEQRI